MSIRNAEDFHEQLRPALKVLGLRPNDYYVALTLVALQFVDNRELDDSISDVAILRALATAIGQPNDRLGVQMNILDGTVIEAICGRFPGHRHRMTGPGGEAIYLPDDHKHRSVVMKNVWRGTAPATRRGVARLRPTPILAEFIPLDISVESVAGFVGALVDVIAAEGAPPSWRKHALNLGVLLAPVEGTEDAATLTAAAIEALVHNRLAAHLKSAIPPAIDALAAASGKTGENFARWFAVGICLGCLDDEDQNLRRKILASFAEHFPAQMRTYLQGLSDRMRVQYGHKGAGRGKQRNPRRWIAAHASWTLNRQVLEVVWPPERGGLTEAAKEAIIDICYAVMSNVEPDASQGAGNKAYAGDAGAPNRRNRDVNGGHLSKIATMRLNIHSLNQMMEALDAEIGECERAALRGGTNSPRREPILRRRTEALQTWRREIVRRLQQGDYEKGKKGKAKKHSSGARVAVPRFEPSWRRLPIKDRITATYVATRRVGRPNAEED